MKKAFTLLEVVISITLMMAIIVFLYKVLDETKSSNIKLKEKQIQLDIKNSINKIFVEDFLEAIDKIEIKEDKKKNAIILLQTKNTYHNPFYTHIIYMIDSENNLVRIESPKRIDLKNIAYDFFENSYVDVLQKDIKYFSILEDGNNSYKIFLGKKDNSLEVFFISIL